MNMLVRVEPIGELARQAVVARDLGSPFVAQVLEAGQRQLWRAPRTAALLDGWPQDRSAAAVAMRFNAALHALARRGEPAALAALYRRAEGDFDHAVADALSTNDDFIAEWMRHTPQTNEVGRAAALVSALLVARRRFGLPFELLELGSSCGLNLNLAHYHYELGGLTVGNPASRVRIAPRWVGAPPPAEPLEVVSAEGVDMHPLDPRDQATRERLLAFVWAGQDARARRLEEALQFARGHPPRVATGDAVEWLGARIASPQSAGRCRVVMHSMVLQYLTPGQRDQVGQILSQSGADAAPERPLAWIAFEWTPQRDAVLLTLTAWPSGEREILAHCHPYGDSVHWRGAPPHA